MDDTEKALFQGIDEKLGAVNVMDATLKEIKGKLTATVESPKDPVAELHDGPLEGITKMQVWDVPVGQALIGGFSAVFVSELVDGFFASQQPMTLGVIKLAAAGVLVKWGGRLLGSTGSKAAALILAYDGIRQILPLDEWAGRLSGGIAARTGGGLAGKAGMGRRRFPGWKPSMREMKEEATGKFAFIQADYYAGAEGR